MKLRLILTGHGLMDLRHHTAQPSLSRQLRELELELDARLLESRAAA
jgi:hypothetical protein